jgi:hypothetical protein
VNVTLGGVTAPSGTDAMKIVKTARRNILLIKDRIQNSEDRRQNTEGLLFVTGVLQDVDEVGQLLDLVLCGVNDGADFLPSGR